MKAIVVALGLAVLARVPERAAARGNDGPKTVALIGQHDLTPAAKPKIDVTTLRSGATWADEVPSRR